MRLVIAEKPSAAQAIAAVVGASRKHKGYLEGGGCLVSWCVGHLVALAPADAYDPKLRKWRRADLPILPDPWKYEVCEDTKGQFQLLVSLMGDTRVTSIVCATDAGREGELIFRLVYDQARCTKPVERLWISSMEESAIAEGFRKLKPAADYDALYRAALCRAQADWLVGINATRLFSVLYGRTLNVGRVMTPTLAMLVQREAAIAAFQPAPFYHVALNCGMLTAESARMASREEAQRIAALCNGKEARILTLEEKEQTEKPPRLYDLTALQRDANRLLGYTAQQTLDYAQALYEKRYISYPRTDSRFLTEDMRETLPGLVGIAAKAMPFSMPPVKVCHAERVIDSTKVSDHHAILPTENVHSAAALLLPAGERSILTLLMARLVCAVDDPCRIRETVAALSCEGQRFTVKGRQMIDPGWRDIADRLYIALLGNTQEQKAPDTLPSLNERMTFVPVTAAVVEGKTTPSKSFTEDTLLAAMESAGNEERPDDAERKGIGTPATRAAIIEKLVKIGLVERRGKKQRTVLLPTEHGIALIGIMPEALKSPSLTAVWEQKLKQVERGALDAAAFGKEIREMVSTLVMDTQKVTDGETLFMDDREIIGTCPRCGSPVVERAKGFGCSSHECSFMLWKDSFFFTNKKKTLTATIAAALLKEGRVFLRGLYSAQKDKTYDATVIMDAAAGERVGFKLDFTKEA